MRVVMNNLYKHTQLQDTFGCNMLALVDDVPRTLRLDQFIRYWVDHQLAVIRRRTQYRLDQAEKDAHIYRGLVKALDMLDEVIALIRRSPNAEVANHGLRESVWNWTWTRTRPLTSYALSAPGTGTTNAFWTFLIEDRKSVV